MLPFYIFETLSVIYLVGTLLSVFFLLKKRPTNFLLGRILPSILIIGLILLVEIQIEPYQINIRRQDIQIGKTTSNLKIALISDFHLSPLKNDGYLERVAKKINQENPDLILFAGDFLFYDHIEKYSSDFTIFKKFSAIAPTYTVFGNHDYGIGDSRHSHLYFDQHEKLAKLLEKAGVKVLVDASDNIIIKGEEIQLVGFDEFWHSSKNPAQAIKNVEGKGLKIGLSHNPDAAYLPESQNLDIILSGHTHGGQLRLPLIGALAEAETFFPRSDYGHFINNSKPKIFNTVGLGESGLPIRFFNHPEIAILNIQ
ncbi:MAG: metallophosphoesterase [Candidatus Magasanikbacteria bacterium]|nr:metallophosphoesterase [Candidatus Magasanikbacteria bacterium]